MDPITWTDETRQLTALSPWARNPRKIENAQAKRLQESFKEFGQPEQIVIGPDNELYNGHQRLKSWLSKFGDIEIDVRVSSRPLTEKEREKLTIYLHKGAVGEFDFDILSAEFEFDDLLEWGFKPFEIGMGDETDINAEWEGMPEYEMENLGSAYNLKMHFATKEDLMDFGKLIDQALTEKTRSVWYPKAEVLPGGADKRWAENDEP